MEKKLLLLIATVAVVALVYLPQASGQSYFRMPSPWTYVCKNGTCTKKLRSDSTVIQSLDTCRLRCGRFRAIWPRPTGDVELSRVVVPFKPQNLRVLPVTAPTDRTRELLNRVITDFQANILKMHPNYVDGTTNPFDKQYDNVIEGTVVQVQVTVDDPEERLTLETSEGYRIDIETQGNVVTAEVRGDTFFGARHGLETLSQLIAYDEQRDTVQIISAGAVIDRPLFAYRGLMLDTSRNFVSIKAMKKLVDGMAYNKLNTLHWHITDSHSFPFYSQRVPQLTLYGAYTPDKIYFPEEIKDFVEYSRIRGVRVIPELDAPSHISSGWQGLEKSNAVQPGPNTIQPSAVSVTSGGPMAVCVNAEPWNQFCSEPPCGQLNPVNEQTYLVLGKLYRDLLGVFDTDAFHMGGDDVNFNCWNSSKEITDFLAAQRRNRTEREFLQLWATFQRRAYVELVRAARGTELTPIVWASNLLIQENIENILDPERYIVHFRNSGRDRSLAGILDKGYRVIFSNRDAWQFDCGFGDWMGEGRGSCGGYKTWQRVYDNNPLRVIAQLNTTEEIDLQPGQVIGGEAAIWSEQVDEMGLEAKVWPRGAALAERLWANPFSSWRDAADRLIHHRERLVKRGINADRLQPEWCLQNQGRCSTN